MSKISLSIRPLCSLLVMLAVSAGLGAAYAADLPASLKPEPRNDDWWKERQQQVVDRVKQGNVDLICIGDSITHGWESGGKATWDQYFGNRNAVNMGFSGDQTQHVLWRLDHGSLTGIHPKAAVIMIGTNNVKISTAEEIAAGIEAIVEKLRRTLPETRILLLAIFPRADVEKELQDKLTKANELIAKLDADPMVEFLDINKVFLDKEGNLPKEIMPDLLHPNEKGYVLWAEAMEPTLGRMMAEADGYKALFNGHDLTGLEQVGGEKQTWKVEDGILYTDGEGGGWLSTMSEYSDFELSLEFKTPAGGNSGVFIRAPRTGNPAFEGSEIQVLDDYAAEYKDLKPYQYCGSVYSTIPSTPRVTKPAGEWQKMVIRIQGQKIQVTLNGTKVVDGDLSEHMDKIKDHPGLQRTKGFIGLQNHGTRLDYRNIVIREL